MGLTGAASDGCAAIRDAGGSCHDADYLSEAAAVCAAQVQGLTPGDDACFAQFTGAQETWEVYAVYDYTCLEDGKYGGQAHLFDIDARTGVGEAAGSTVFEGGYGCPW